MNSKKFELTEELLQRYYDGELEQAASVDVEQALTEDTQAAATLDDYRAVGRMMRAASQDALPDQLSAHRTWEAISGEISSDPVRPAMRKPTAWLTAVAAAAALVLYFSPLSIVPSAQASNELDIESIDCNYTSFMLLQPEAEDGHTIIWINDPE
jgi:anti-sigma factor RsiW